jgi:hypothetical protein
VAASAFQFATPAPSAESHPFFPSTGLDAKFSPKFYYEKKFSITLKCRHMHRVLNVDEIKN